MIQSQQVLEWQAKAREEATEKTRIEERRSAVKDLLEERFGPLPADLWRGMESMTDYGQIRVLLPLAARADSLAAFRTKAGM